MEMPRMQEEKSSQRTLPITCILGNIVRNELTVICHERANVTSVTQDVCHSSRFEVNSFLPVRIKVSELISAGDKLVYFNDSPQIPLRRLGLCRKKKLRDLIICYRERPNSCIIVISTGLITKKSPVC